MDVTLGFGTVGYLAKFHFVDCVLATEVDLLFLVDVRSVRLFLKALILFWRVP